MRNRIFFSISFQILFSVVIVFLLLFKSKHLEKILEFFFPSETHLAFPNSGLLFY